MEILKKIEDLVSEWLRPLPSWPSFLQAKLARNLWWVALVFAIAYAVGALGDLINLLGRLGDLGKVPAINESFVAKSALGYGTSLVVKLLTAAILYYAVEPLRRKQKPGWYLLLTALTIGAVGVVAGAVLTFSTLGFITRLLFEGAGVALLTYMLFQTRSQFMHTENSKGAGKGR